MNEIINIILEESDAAIEKAYKDGYKKAAEEYIPEIQYYKSLSESYKEKYSTVNIVWLTIGAAMTGFIAGNVSGFCIGLNITM